MRYRQRETPQSLIESLTLDEPLGEQHLAATQAERKLDQEVLILLLATQGEILTGRAVAKRILPVQGGHDRLDLSWTQTARIKPAHDGAHAGAGDRIDRHVHLLQHLQHADVRRAARTAA